MYAIIANGIQAVCKTQRELDTIIAVYPYPKFVKCHTESEAYEWIRQHSRNMNLYRYKNYGNTATLGYASMEYYIADDCIFCNIDTKLVGFLKIMTTDKDVKVMSKQDLIKVKVCNIVLEDNKIAHHAIAIRRLLKVIGIYIDVNIVVPDMSVYLAATKYKGNDYRIKGLQKDISQRIGGISFSVKG